MGSADQTARLGITGTRGTLAFMIYSKIVGLAAFGVRDRSKTAPSERYNREYLSQPGRLPYSGNHENVVFIVTGPPPGKICRTVIGRDTLNGFTFFFMPSIFLSIMSYRMVAFSCR